MLYKIKVYSYGLLLCLLCLPLPARAENWSNNNPSQLGFNDAVGYTLSDPNQLKVEIYQGYGRMRKPVFPNPFGEYDFRKPLTIENTSTYNRTDFLVSLVMDKTTMSVKSDYSDIRIAIDGNEVARTVTVLDPVTNPNLITITFPVTIAAGEKIGPGEIRTAYMYYGNPNATPPIYTYNEVNLGYNACYEIGINRCGANLLIDPNIPAVILESVTNANNNSVTPVYGNYLEHVQVNTNNTTNNHFTNENLKYNTGLDIPITDDTYLEYYIRAESSQGDYRSIVWIGHSGCDSARDGDWQKWGGGVVDQNARSASYTTNLNDVFVGRWYKRTIRLGADVYYVGKNICDIILMTNEVSSLTTAGRSFNFYYDAARVYNGIPPSVGIGTTAEANNKTASFSTTGEWIITPSFGQGIIIDNWFNVQVDTFSPLNEITNGVIRVYYSYSTDGGNTWAGSLDPASGKNWVGVVDIIADGQIVDLTSLPAFGEGNDRIRFMIWMNSNDNGTSRSNFIDNLFVQYNRDSWKEIVHVDGDPHPLIDHPIAELGFNSAGGYTFSDPTKIEVASGAVKLKASQNGLYSNIFQSIETPSFGDGRNILKNDGINYGWDRVEVFLLMPSTPPNGTIQLEYIYSNDAGATWTTGGPIDINQFPSQVVDLKPYNIPTNHNGKDRIKFKIYMKSNNDGTSTSYYVDSLMLYYKDGGWSDTGPVTAINFTNKNYQGYEFGPDPNNILIDYDNGLVKLKRQNYFPEPFRDYAYKKNLIIQNNSQTSPIPIQFTVTLDITGQGAVDIFNKGRATLHGDDVRIGFFDGTNYIELDRHMVKYDSVNNIITIRFATQRVIPAGGQDTGYYLFVGSYALSTPPSNYINIYGLRDDFTGTTIDATKWEEFDDGGIPGYLYQDDMLISTGGSYQNPDTWTDPPSNGVLTAVELDRSQNTIIEYDFTPTSGGAIVMGSLMPWGYSSLKSQYLSDRVWIGRSTLLTAVYSYTGYRCDYGFLSTVKYNMRIIYYKAADGTRNTTYQIKRDDAPSYTTMCTLTFTTQDLANTDKYKFAILNRNLPFNIDNFVVRKYVSDVDGVILEPTVSIGQEETALYPVQAQYLITPKFSTPLEDILNWAKVEVDIAGQNYGKLSLLYQYSNDGGITWLPQSWTLLGEITPDNRTFVLSTVPATGGIGQDMMRFKIEMQSNDGTAGSYYVDTLRLRYSDTVPPELVSTNAIDSYTIEVVYSEQVKPDEALNPLNYLIEGVGPQAGETITILPGGIKFFKNANDQDIYRISIENPARTDKALTTSTDGMPNYKITVNNVTDWIWSISRQYTNPPDPITHSPKNVLDFKGYDNMPVISLISVRDTDGNLAPNPDTHTNNRVVNVSINSNDIGGAINKWIVREDITQSPSCQMQGSGEYTTPQFSYQIGTLGEGIKTLYVWICDNTNNLTGPKSYDIDLDTLVPSVLSVIPFNNWQIDILYDSTDSGLDNAMQNAIVGANYSFTANGAGPLQVITMSDITKTDPNYTGYLDKVQGFITVNSPVEALGGNKYRVTVKNTTDPNYFAMSTDITPQDTNNNYTMGISSGLNTGITDKAGNPLSNPQQDFKGYDRLPEVTLFSVKDPTETTPGYTNQAVINVTMTERDIGGSVTKWFIRESNTPPLPSDCSMPDGPGVYSATPTSYTLQGGEGQITLYAWVCDNTSPKNVSNAVTTSIILDLTNPNNVSAPTSLVTDSWHATITFNEGVVGAMNIANYSSSVLELQLKSIAGIDKGALYTLTTYDTRNPSQNIDEDGVQTTIDQYCITINNITDLAGNPLTNNQTCFYGYDNLPEIMGFSLKDQLSPDPQTTFSRSYTVTPTINARDRGGAITYWYISNSPNPPDWSTKFPWPANSYTMPPNSTNNPFGESRDFYLWILDNTPVGRGGPNSNTAPTIKWTLRVDPFNPIIDFVNPVNSNQVDVVFPEPLKSIYTLKNGSPEKLLFIGTWDGVTVTGCTTPQPGIEQMRPSYGDIFAKDDPLNKRTWFDITYDPNMDKYSFNLNRRFPGDGELYGYSHVYIYVEGTQSPVDIKVELTGWTGYYYYFGQRTGISLWVDGVCIDAKRIIPLSLTPGWHRLLFHIPKPDTSYFMPAFSYFFNYKITDVNSNPLNWRYSLNDPQGLDPLDLNEIPISDPQNKLNYSVDNNVVVRDVASLSDNVYRLSLCNGADTKCTIPLSATTTYNLVIKNNDPQNPKDISDLVGNRIDTLDTSTGNKAGFRGFDNIVPVIDSFSIKDPTETTAGYTNSQAIDIAIQASDVGGDPACMAWLINESLARPTYTDFMYWDSVEAKFKPSFPNKPTSYTLSSLTQGQRTIYAWVMDGRDTNPDPLITDCMYKNASVLTSKSMQTIIFDNTAPQIRSTARTVDSTHIDVTYTEKVREGNGTALWDALTPSNYSITGITVNSVTSMGNNIYRLALGSAVTNLSYTLTVSNVEDMAGNSISTAPLGKNQASLIPTIKAASISPFTDGYLAKGSLNNVIGRLRLTAYNTGTASATITKISVKNIGSGSALNGMSIYTDNNNDGSITGETLLGTGILNVSSGKYDITINYLLPVNSPKDILLAVDIAGSAVLEATVRLQITDGDIVSASPYEVDPFGNIYTATFTIWDTLSVTNPGHPLGQALNTGSTGSVIERIRFTSNTTQDVSVTEIGIRQIGTAPVSSLTVWFYTDNNTDGSITGETQIGTGSAVPDVNGIFRLSITGGFLVPAKSSNDILAVVDVGITALNGQTVRLEMNNGYILVNLPATVSPITTFSSSTFTICNLCNPPGAITDLRIDSNTVVENRLNANFLTVAWTAPGSDGYTGTVSGYEVRYSTLPITDLTWNNAILSGSPSPIVAAGQTQVYKITGLRTNTVYYIAVKAYDNEGLYSPISNIVVQRTAMLSGWNLVSVPYKLSSASPQTVFSPVLGGANPAVTQWYSLWTGYNAGTGTWDTTDPAVNYKYIDNYYDRSLQNINEGQGYYLWAYNPYTVYEGISGYPQVPAPYFEIILKAGWNMIGNPYLNDVILDGAIGGPGVTVLYDANSDGIAEEFTYDSAVKYDLDPVRQGIEGIVGPDIKYWDGTTSNLASFDYRDINGIPLARLETWRGYFIFSNVSCKLRVYKPN